MNSAVGHNLKTAWFQLKEANPKLRIRNAANLLRVSEYELLLTGLGVKLIHLDPRFGEMLQALQSVGDVMALTRNEQVVHEKHGTYTDFRITGQGSMGICLGEIDLRVFFHQWRYALCVREASGDTPRESIQFFDGEGSAVHKVYQTGRTDREAWRKLVDNFSARCQIPEFELVARQPPDYPQAGQRSPKDVRDAWEALKDVHHFHAMLKRLGISRMEALSLVGEDYAQPLTLSDAEQSLRLAQQRGVSLMLFVGNAGVVQIHTGCIHKLLRVGPWFNVLDPKFNLHLNTEQIASVWLVRRPSSDGIISSLEMYNVDQELVLTLFGERKPGQVEQADWQQLLSDLEQRAW